MLLNKYKNCQLLFLINMNIIYKMYFKLSVLGTNTSNISLLNILDQKEKLLKIY